MTNDAQDRYAKKVALLLRKAEAEGTTAEEAESLVAKAQQLLTQYAIDEELLARAQGKTRQEKLGTGKIEFTGIFQTVTMNIGFACAKANNCRSHYVKRDSARPTRHDVHIFGYESDVEAAQMLAASIEIQCVAAMKQWERTPEARTQLALLSKMERFKDRRQFIIGFVTTVANRLYTAKRDGERDATAAEAKRTGNANEAASSVALVLRTKEERVQDWYNELHPPSSLRKSSRNYQSGSHTAHGAGTQAGHRADLGGGKIGQRGQIGGGR